MKCVTPLGLYTITAHPRTTRPAHPSTSHRPVKSDPADHQSGAPGRPRLSHPCKLLRLSRLAITMHNVRHMEWRFYRVKPATGGEGVRPGYTTATATHSPPQIFFRQLAPFAVDATRRHATFPYVVQDISQLCAAAGLARYVVVSVAGFLFALLYVLRYTALQQHLPRLSTMRTKEGSFLLALRL
jgi:hypothetical protein